MWDEKRGISSGFQLGFSIESLAQFNPHGSTGFLPGFVREILRCYSVMVAKEISRNKCGENRDIHPVRGPKSNAGIPTDVILEEIGPKASSTTILS